MSGARGGFTEGAIDAIRRVSAREWRGRGGRLTARLAEGDACVSRRRAGANPAGADAIRCASSGSEIVEFRRRTALPTENGNAISQQMVIYKTEQLASLGSPSSFEAPGEGWLDQSRMIGMEGVSAEVVFLSGGEVADEVEEAANSDELAEGRLENRGRAEMVRAINFMSRAEAQLNDGRAEEALPLERQALASLERALDRRRYFLRTLPDRSRIDTTRRLTADRREARSWVRDRAADPVPSRSNDSAK